MLNEIEIKLHALIFETPNTEDYRCLDINWKMQTSFILRLIFIYFELFSSLT